MASKFQPARSRFTKIRITNTPHDHNRMMNTQFTVYNLGKKISKQPRLARTRIKKTVADKMFRFRF